MTAKLIELNDHRPMQDLVEVRFSRTHEGKIFATVLSASDEWMEEVCMFSLPERFDEVASIISEGTSSIKEQAEKHRAKKSA